MAGAELSAAEIAALLTHTTLKRIGSGIRANIRDAISRDGPQIFSDAKINTVVRIAHFFAQVLKETGGLKRLDENLNYTSAARIRQVWPSKFRTDASAARYVRKPVELANFVYAKRNGNGSVASGDGWRYRGSGLIQLTGKGNFRSVGQLIGLGDHLVDFPDQVREPKSAVKIAVGYWTVRNINSVADGERPDDVDRVTRLVNPFESATGKKERRNNFERALAILRSARKAVPEKALAKTASVLEATPSALDFGGEAARYEELEVEVSTEPSAEDLLLDRMADKGLCGEFPEALSLPSVYWPSKDDNAPDYFHLAKLETDPADAGNFELTPADLELLLKANHFVLPDKLKTIAIALRGAMFGGRHEEVQRASIRCMDTRPDHANFRCLLGFWYRRDGQVTLFSGSTVPCPRYMKNYYFKKNDLPYESKIDCNMAPTGHYVFRVATHDKGRIDPALRMSEPDSIATDAAASVWRTKSDLTFGLADELEPPRSVFDNVHCSYFLNHKAEYEAAFSSAGCLTVRGRKDPTDQWKKFQRELTKIGKGKRVRPHSADWQGGGACEPKPQSAHVGGSDHFTAPSAPAWIER